MKSSRFKITLVAGQRVAQPLRSSAPAVRNNTKLLAVNSGPPHFYLFYFPIFLRFLPVIAINSMIACGLGSLRGMWTRPQNKGKKSVKAPCPITIRHEIKRMLPFFARGVRFEDRRKVSAASTSVPLWHLTARGGVWLVPFLVHG